MKDFVKGFAVAAGAGTLIAGIVFAVPFLASLARGGSAEKDAAAVGAAISAKTTAERIAEARARSADVRALYMTAEVANDRGAGATRLRNRLIMLADTTEINALVIDVKEVCGPEYDEKNLAELLDELHRKNIWAVARIVVFKDASQRELHPDWYLTRATAKATDESACARKSGLTAKNPAGTPPHAPFWRDNKGGWWMDPASLGARGYIAGFAEKMIDLGFDELQFDYVRFPSDGDVSRAIYPSWDGRTPRHKVLKDFFAYLQKRLKAYRPEIIISADLFGYVADQGEDDTIGQRLEDIAPLFDYLSFMVYPSHYYAGLMLPADVARGLPAVNFTLAEARTHPDVVVGRSMLAALNFFPGAHASSTPATSPNALLRPWLEDFFHEQDRIAGRPWGAQKVRMQIDAAEQAGARGWLLWNASNVYSEAALKKDPE
jgi:hypothetical protein